MNHDSEWNLQYQTVCQKAFAEINQKLDRIDKLLRGNGDDVGIKTRLDRLEQSESSGVSRCGLSSRRA